jgi:hypothetical protein
MRQKLTPATIRKARAAPGAERTIIWDATLPGFGLMITAGGHKSFVCQYRADGRSRRDTISGVLSLSDARKEALGVLGKAAKGADPLAARQKVTAAAENTLRAVADEYMKREGSRLRSKGERQRVLDRYILPRLGSRQIDSITRRDVVNAPSCSSTWPRSRMSIQPAQTGHCMKCSASAVGCLPRRFPMISPRLTFIQPIYSRRTVPDRPAIAANETAARTHRVVRCVN